MRSTVSLEPNKISPLIKPRSTPTLLGMELVLLVTAIASLMRVLAIPVTIVIVTMISIGKTTSYK